MMTALCAVAGAILLAANDLPPHSCLPPIGEVCLSVTNYWPYEWYGEWVLMDGWNGQCDSDCSVTAIMEPVTLDVMGKRAAVPASLLGYTIHLPKWGALYGWDTFGNETYRNGVFWHDGYGRYVIGLDIFVPDGLHYLECDWYMEA